jgi:hypothetical protein
MPMELYSSEAFVRDVVNAISSSEGKPLDIGGSHHKDIDRAYTFQLISDAKRAVNGQGDGALQAEPGDAFWKRKIASSKKKALTRKKKRA